MAGLFAPGANAYYRVALFGLITLVFCLAAGGMAYVRSPWHTGEGRFVEQVVPFSHQHHVGQLKIDCRYCHESVEESSYAGIPATEVCMSCHSRVWTNAEMLEPVRDSMRTGHPLRWNRVYIAPDYVYFNHSIHIAKGIGCETCHGRIDRQPLTAMAVNLRMSWCVECHRHPERHVRPRSEIFTMGYQRADDEELGKALLEEYNVQTRTDCYTCHR
jgi:hypothetical protein